MKNAASNIDIAPEVHDLFNTVEDAFEKLASHGFKCAAVLHGDGKIFKLERESAGPCNGLIRKIHDTAERMAANETPAKTPEYLSACYGEGAAEIEDAVENLRGLTSTIRTLASADTTLDLDKDDALTNIGTLAKLAAAEVEGIGHAIAAMDENFQ